ncbi:MAG: glutamate racemase [Cellvibrionaceae bacterium]
MSSQNSVQPIVVFDSGVGGLSVLSHLREALPNERFSYVMDDAWCPYGDKADLQLSERILSIIGRVIRQQRPKMLVVACNTASTLALELLRKTFDLPFVGVVPALKAAADNTTVGSVVLLATEATIQRDYVDHLWRKFGGSRRLIKVACPELVVLAEDKCRGREVSLETIESLMGRVKAQLAQSGRQSNAQGLEPVSAFVLGCTHFPFLVDELATTWGQPCLWLDSGVAIARRVDSLLRGSETAQLADVTLPVSSVPSGLVPDQPRRSFAEFWYTNHQPDPALSAALERLALNCAGRVLLV